MTPSQRLAEILASNSWATRRLRRAREWWLETAYGRSGLSRSVNGVTIRVPPRYRWYFAPTYDAHVAGYIRERMQPGAVCLNAGANLGVYALQFAHWSAPDGRVFAFEPNPQTAAVLRRVIAMNHLTERVSVIERAVAGSVGHATFHISGTEGMSRLGEPNPALATRSQAITVSVDTIDHFCMAMGVYPAAVMIDVEGFEIAALLGARELFTAHRPSAAVVEMHPNAWALAGTTRDDFEQLLTEYRLRAVPLSGQSDPLGDYGHIALEPEWS